MTFLRHASRLIHQSVVDYAKDQLDALGWFGPDVPFGLPALTVIESRPFVGSNLDNKVEAGVVAITMGNEPEPVLEELGGPLSAQDYAVYVDIFMAGESAALAVATDVRDAFLGRHASSVRAIPVINQTTSTAVPDWMIRFEEVARYAPEHTFPLAWHSVQLTARVWFPEEVY